MQHFKRHIVLLFLGGFLFPQVAGSLHFFVVSHNFSAEKDNSIHTPEPGSLFHSCVYHFSGFSGGILPPDLVLISNNFLTPVKSNFFSLENYVHEDNFNFQLRGPPMLS